MRRELKLHIGVVTAEQIKKTVAGVIKRDKEILCEAKGISSDTGFPKSVMVSSNDLYTIFEEFVHNITERVREVLDETPPELQGDIILNGITLTGGGCMLYGLSKRIQDEIGVMCHCADDAAECVVRGSGIALGGIDTVTDPTHIFHKKAYIHE